MVFAGWGESVAHLYLEETNVGRHCYRIIVSGRLGRITSEVFEDLYVEYDGTNTGLTGEMDQAWYNNNYQEHVAVRAKLGI